MQTLLSISTEPLMKRSNATLHSEHQTGHKLHKLAEADPRIVKAALEHERQLLERERKHKQSYFRRLKLLRLSGKYKADLPEPDNEVDYDQLENISDFDYRLQFADELPAYIRHRLETAAARLKWKKSDLRPGFFAALEGNGIDWKSEISVLSSICQDWVDRVVSCGIWTRGRGHPKNSGRCHLHDHCRLCSWIDYGSVLQSSLGVESGTFERCRAAHLASYAIHLSVRDSAANARAEGRDIRAEDWDFRSATGFFSGKYDPRPVSLQREEGCDLAGVNTSRYVFLAAQSALKSVHDKGRGLLRGFRSKAETALDLMPLRGLPHVHAIGNGIDDSAQHLADELKARMDELLSQHARKMQEPLYTSVRVFRLLTPEDLEKAALYMEKPIPVGELVKQVLARPEAKRPDGSWDEQFLENLKWELLEFYDIAYRLRSKYQTTGPELKGTTRRCCMGNMRFGKGSILSESDEHREYRLQKAQEQREKRRQLKQEKNGQLKGMALRKDLRSASPPEHGAVLEDGPEY